MKNAFVHIHTIKWNLVKAFNSESNVPNLQGSLCHHVLQRCWCKLTWRSGMLNSLVSFYPVLSNFEAEILYYFVFLCIECREEENLIFCFGALFNSTPNFTQSGWHIPFSPDLHFRLPNGWAAKHTLFGWRRRLERTCLWSPLLSDAL